MEHKNSEALLFDKNIEYVYSEAKVLLNRYNKHNKLYLDTLVNFSLTLIPVIQDLITGPHKGVYKKRLLLKVIILIVEQNIEWDSEKDKQLALSIVENVLPNTINTAIAISKGIIDLGKGKKNCCLCL